MPRQRHTTACTYAGASAGNRFAVLPLASAHIVGLRCFSVCSGLPPASTTTAPAATTTPTPTLSLYASDGSGAASSLETMASSQEGVSQEGMCPEGIYQQGMCPEGSRVLDALASSQLSNSSTSSTRSVRGWEGARVRGAEGLRVGG